MPLTGLSIEEMAKMRAETGPFVNTNSETPVQLDVSSEPSYGDIAAEETKSTIERLGNVYDASDSAKFNAAVGMFNDNIGGTIYNYFQYDRGIFRDDDPEFIAKINPEFIGLTIESLGLPNESAKVLATARNQEHFDDLVGMEIERRVRNETISNTLNSQGGFFTESGVATIGTSLLDVDMLLGGAYYKLAKLGVSTKALHSTAAASNFGLGFAAHEMNPNTFSAEDAIMYGVVGSMADSLGVALGGRYATKAEEAALRDIADQARKDAWLAQHKPIDFLNARFDKEARSMNAVTGDFTLIPEYQRTIIRKRDEVNRMVRAKNEAYDNIQLAQKKRAEAEMLAAETKRLEDELEVTMAKSKEAISARMVDEAMAAEKEPLLEQLAAKKAQIVEMVAKKNEFMKAAAKQAKLDKLIEKETQRLAEVETKKSELTGSMLEKEKAAEMADQISEQKAKIDKLKKERDDSIKARKEADKAEKEAAQAEKEQADIEAELNRKKEARKASLAQMAEEESKSGLRDELAAKKAKIEEMKSKRDAADKVAKEAKKEADNIKKLDEAENAIKKSVAGAMEGARKERAAAIIEEHVDMAREILAHVGDDIDNFRAKMLDMIKRGELKKAEARAIAEALIKDMKLPKEVEKRIINDFENFDSAGNVKSTKDTVKLVPNANGEYFVAVETKTKDGKIIKRLSKNKIPMAIILALTVGSGSAMASDGSTSGGDLMMMAVLGVIGAGAVLMAAGKVMATGGVGKNAKALGAKINSAFEFAKAIKGKKEWTSAVDKMVEESKLSILSTYNKLANHSPEAKALADKMLWNGTDGRTATMDTAQQVMSRGYVGQYMKVANESFGGWLKENKRTVFGSMVSNFMLATSYRKEFETLVSYHTRTGVPHPSKFVMDAVAKNKEMYSRILDDMVNSGVQSADRVKKGLKDMAEGESYLPQTVYVHEIAGLLAVSDANRKAIINAFAEMMAPTRSAEKTFEQITKEATDYLDTITEINKFRGSVDNTIKKMEEFLVSRGYSGEALADALDDIGELLGAKKEAWGRMKERKRLDWKAFKPFQVELKGGGTKTMTLDGIFEMSAHELLERYAGGASGLIAMADRGYKTVADLMRDCEVAAKGDAQIYQLLEDSATLILGRPVADVGSEGVQFVTNIRNYTTAVKLTGVVFSMMSEGVKMIFKMRGLPLVNMKNDFLKVMGKGGKQDLVLDKLVHEYGFGTHYQRRARHFRQYGEDGYLEATAGAGGRLGEAARDFTINAFGMVPLSDTMTRLSARENMKLIGKWIAGKYKFSDVEMKYYGFTDKTSMINKYIKIDKDGNVLDIHMDAMRKDREAYMEFSKVIDNMIRHDIADGTIGGTPMFMKKDSAGMLAGHLLTFPINAFNSIGMRHLESTFKLDPRGMLDSGAWFVGAYIGAAWRAEVFGRELSDEELMIRAVLSMPQFGIIGVPGSMIDPVTLGMLQDVENVVKTTIANGDYQ